MGFLARIKKLTNYIYSPTDPASEDDIRAQIDNIAQEVYDNTQSALTSQVDGDSGMDIIGMTPIDGVMTKPQQSLEYLKANKTPLTGDHLGTWQGFSPSQVDQTLRDEVEANTSEISDLMTENINNFPRLGGEIDDTQRLNRAIDKLVANGNAGNTRTTLIVPIDLIVSDDIVVKGKINSPYNFPFKPQIVIKGMNNAKISSTKATGSLITLGVKGSTDLADMMDFKLIIEDIILDGQGNELIMIDGSFTVGSYQWQLELNRVRIIDFEGANSTGIDASWGGVIAKNCVIVGGFSNGGKGIVVRVTAVKLLDCWVQYCTHGLYFVNFAETTFHMWGGLIQSCTNFLTFEGGGFLNDTITFTGTFLGECYYVNGAKLINTIDTVTFGTISKVIFTGCQFDTIGSPVDYPLLDFDMGNLAGEVTLVGCNYFGTSSTKLITVGQFIKLNLIGCADFETSGTKENINQFYINEGNKINARNGHRMLHTYVFPNLTSTNQNQMLGSSPNLIYYVAPKDGVVVGVTGYYTQPITSGTISFSLMINGVIYGFNTADNVTLSTGVQSFSATVVNDSSYTEGTTMNVTKGDLIGIVAYNTGADVGGTLLSELTMSY